MDTAEIVVRDVMATARNAIVQVLWRAVRRSREPALAHAQWRIAAYDFAAYNCLQSIQSLAVLWTPTPNVSRACLPKSQTW